jgi:NAD(P)H-dependent FMN reductase
MRSNTLMTIDYPPKGRALKDAIAAAGAALFVTPEHKRSIPGPRSFTEHVLADLPRQLV